MSHAGSLGGSGHFLRLKQWEADGGWRRHRRRSRHVQPTCTQESTHLRRRRSNAKAAEETLSVGPLRGGNTSRPDLISTQPLPAAHLPAEASNSAGWSETPQLDFGKRTCPRCGLPASGPRSSKSSVHRQANQSRSKGGPGGSQQNADMLEDSCFGLLLACLWCRFSVVLLGVMEACSGCLQALCPACCCAPCCCGAQEGEGLGCRVHCQSVLLESCCEATECLEFCLDCCEICHRS